MKHKVAMAIMALLAGGCLILTSLPASAEPGQQQHQQKAQGQSRSGGGGARAMSPRGEARQVGPRSSHSVSPRSSHRATARGARTVTPRSVHGVSPRGARPTTARAPHRATARGARTVTPRSVHGVSPRGTRPTTARAPHRVTPRGDTAHVATAGKLRGMPARGAGRTMIRGHNYSVWRGGHRVRHGQGWGTFVAIGALSAIVIGSSEYYPYAYISAPEPYCEGLTDDGCQLRWQEVETVEGDEINQCVAYCPWQ